MDCSELRRIKTKVVGINQTLKAVKGGKAKRVYLARDVEPRLAEPVYQLCQEKKIPVIEVNSMAELGVACGIKVKAAAAAVID